MYFFSLENSFFIRLYITSKKNDIFSIENNFIYITFLDN